MAETVWTIRIPEYDGEKDGRGNAILRLAGFAAAEALARRYVLYQQSAQMIRVFVVAKHNDKSGLRRDKNEIRVLHFVAFAAGHLDFERLEWHRPHKLSN
jgi:hypothetical protein